MNTYPYEDSDLQLLVSNPEHTFCKLIESVKNGVYVTDIHGRILFVNQSFVDILGYDSREELLGMNIGRDFYLNPNDRNILIAEMGKNGYVRDYEIKIRKKDRSVAVLSLTGNFVHNEDGRPVGVQGIIHDITEKKRLEELRHEKQKLQELLNFGEKVSGLRNLDKLMDYIVAKVSAILEAGKCSIMLYDETNSELCIKGAKGLGEEIVMNTRLKLGESIAGQVARDGNQVLVSDIEHDRHFAREKNHSYKGKSFMSVAIKLNERLLGVVNVADKKSGVEVFTPLDLKMLSAIVTHSAVAIENASLYREMEYLCVTDPLTQLANYRSFVKCVDNEIQRFKRFSQPFSLLVIDVDDFKDYNISFGHMEGDLLLKEFGKLFSRHLRVIDRVCRYGGDEFVILLPGTRIERAKIVAEKLRNLVHRHPCRQLMTVSIGVCEYKDPASRFDFFLKGDRALFHAKMSGKDRICVCGQREEGQQKVP